MGRGGYFDFGVRKRKIVPLAGFPNAWPTEFPGNGGSSLTICVSIEKLNGGRYNHMHFKTLMGGTFCEKIIAKNETFGCTSPEIADYHLSAETKNQTHRLLCQTSNPILQASQQSVTKKKTASVNIRSSALKA